MQVIAVAAPFAHVPGGTSIAEKAVAVQAFALVAFQFAILDRAAPACDLLLAPPFEPQPACANARTPAQQAGLAQDFMLFLAQRSKKASVARRKSVSCQALPALPSGVSTGSVAW